MRSICLNCCIDSVFFQFFQWHKKFFKLHCYFPSGKCNSAAIVKHHFVIQDFFYDLVNRIILVRQIHPLCIMFCDALMIFTSYTDGPVYFCSTDRSMRTDAFQNPLRIWYDRSFTLHPLRVRTPWTLQITALHMIYQSVSISVLGVIESFLKYLHLSSVLS